MNLPLYLCCLLPLIIVLITELRSDKNIIVKKIIDKKKKGVIKMYELAQRFIGKECLIYTMSSSLSGNISGIVSEVKDGWLVLTNGDNSEIINLEYVVRIREYPRNKNGKKKVIVD